jgi:tetratricopeptide (TPR) repeat protein
MITLGAGRTDRSAKESVMKCILCKMCEAGKATINRKGLAWLRAQENVREMWDREPEEVQERIRYAYGLFASDPVRYFQECLTLAESGSMWSANCLGAAFGLGVGTKRDLDQAEKWYRRAYEGGSDDALLQLGALYSRSRQYAKAAEVYRTGVERNWAPAMYRLAWVYSKCPGWRARRDEARTLLERAAVAGDISAKNFLAGLMARGRFGVRRVPDGFRLMVSATKEMAELAKDEKLPAPDPDERSGLAGYFSRLCPLVAKRFPA